MILDGRVVLVSGIGPGLGRAIALACVAQGARIALGARSQDTIAGVAAEVEALGGEAVALATDITSTDACDALAAAAIAQFGRIDVLVNNAFVQPPLQTLETTTAEVWRDAFEVNVIGSMQMAQAVLPQMKAQGSGSIVFIGSMSARRIRRRFGVYAAAKSALMAAATTLAREHGGDGIRVNTVLPGYIWGPSLQWFFGYLADKQGRTRQDVYDEVAAETALGRIPTPEEIADAVVFFASDASRAITGQTLDVNAGHWFA